MTFRPKLMSYPQTLNALLNNKINLHENKITNLEQNPTFITKNHDFDIIDEITDRQS